MDYCYLLTIVRTIVIFASGLGFKCILQRARINYQNLSMTRFSKLCSWCFSLVSHCFSTYSHIELLCISSKFSQFHKFIHSLIYFSILAFFPNGYMSSIKLSPFSKTFFKCLKLLNNIPLDSVNIQLKYL